MFQLKPELISYNRARKRDIVEPVHKQIITRWLVHVCLGIRQVNVDHLLKNLLLQIFQDLLQLLQST